MATIRGEQLDADLEITDSLTVDNIRTDSGQDLFIFASSADINMNPDLRFHIGNPPTSDFTKMSFVGSGGSVADGPSIAYFNSPDSTYPIQQEVRISHDNITCFYDSYNDNANERSSDAGSNFKIEKKADQLTFNYASGVAQGSIISWAEAFKITTSGLDIPEAAKASLGYIQGFLPKYNTTTTIAITNGQCIANGKFYSKTSSTSVSPTLAAAFDHHYIYIDDSASIPPAPIFISSTTEPSYNATKFGWYSGDDRCVAVIPSRSSSVICPFESAGNNNDISLEFGLTFFLLFGNLNPTGAWQTPNDTDGSEATPVNATRIQIHPRNTDAGADVGVGLSCAEHAAIATAINSGQWYGSSYNKLEDSIWINLGASRNIKVGGLDVNENDLDGWIVGYAFSR